MLAFEARSAPRDECGLAIPEDVQLRDAHVLNVVGPRVLQLERRKVAGNKCRKKHQKQAFQQRPPAKTELITSSSELIFSSFEFITSSSEPIFDIVGTFWFIRSKLATVSNPSHVNPKNTDSIESERRQPPKLATVSRLRSSKAQKCRQHRVGEPPKSKVMTISMMISDESLWSS